MTPEGRIINTGTDTSPVWKWEYNLTDHLGNVRVVIAPSSTAGSATVLQEDNYYPFGMKISTLCNSSSNTSNDYLYNGKQLQTDFNLNWYDYGARFYDPALGRFHTVDPLADFFPENSPYMYASNSPINHIDLYGLSKQNKIKDLWQDITKNIAALFGYHQKGRYTGNNVEYEYVGSGKKTSDRSTKSQANNNTSSSGSASMRPFTESIPPPSVIDVPQSNFAELQPESPRLQNYDDLSRNPFSDKIASFHGDVFVAGRSNTLLDNNNGFQKFVNDIAVYLNNNPSINIRITISTGADSETNTAWNNKLKYGKVAIERGFTIMDVSERAGVSPNRLIYDPQKDVQFNKEKAITIQIAK